ncbi:MAG: acetylglutamate kinase [Prevotella sp.]|nr:acetylglutamate kinase [Prevotella sp.]
MSNIYSNNKELPQSEKLSTPLPNERERESISKGQGESLFIIKVGGAVVEDEAQLRQLLSDFRNIEGRKILVHGGGRRATAIAAKLGIETKMVNGRRVTDAEMLEVVTMVYGGLVNKTIVARLQALGIDAAGLTGADMDCIRSHRRPPVSISGQEGATLDYGFVGDVDSVSAAKIAHFIEAGITPVVAPLTHDGQGQMLNTNADTIAAEVAKGMAAEGYDVTLVYCFEKAGVLANADDETSVIPLITSDSFRQLVADGTISGGMLPKIENALAATHAGVSRVLITHSTDLTARHGTVVKA